MKLLRSIELDEAKPVRYGELPQLIARALHPADYLKRAAAAMNLEDELQQLVDTGKLVVRDPLTLGPHPSPTGDALKRAVVFVDDLQPILEFRGIALLRKRHGSGPELWTIDNAVTAIGDAYGWHAPARQTLTRQLIAAVTSGDLRARHPHTDLPYRPDQVSPFYDLFLVSDVNDWLKSQSVPYRLTAEVAEDPHVTKPVELNEDEPRGVNADESHLSGDAPSPTAPMPRKVTPIGRRSNILDRVIADARKAAREPNDYQQAWGELVRMARLPGPPFPLLEYVDGEIKYDGESGPKFLSKEALRRRIERSPWPPAQI